MPTNKAKPVRKRAGRPAEIDRGALLDAAESLFAELGYEGATIRQLAQRAGCNLALISYHFGGKEGLYQAVLLRHFNAMSEGFTGVTHSDDELARAWPELPDSEQRRFCAEIFELTRDKTQDSPMQRIIAREMLTGAEQIAAVLGRSEGGMHRLLTRRLEELRARGRLRADLDLRFAVLGLIGPMVYSCVAGPIIRGVYGFKAIDEAYLRGLCLHQTRTFFDGCGA